MSGSSSSPITFTRTPVQEETLSNASSELAVSLSMSNSSTSSLSTDITTPPVQEETASIGSQELAVSINMSGGVQRANEEDHSSSEKLDDSATPVPSPAQSLQLPADPEKTILSQPHLLLAENAPRENLPKSAALSEEPESQPDSAALSKENELQENPPDSVALSEENRLQENPPESEGSSEETTASSNHILTGSLNGVPRLEPATCSQSALLNTCSYKSKELSVVMPRKKLLQSGKKGHTWCTTIPVKLGRWKKVSVRIFLFPRVSDHDGMEKTKLDVMVQTGWKLLRMLREFDSCQIKVETEILDPEAGQNIGCTQFFFHTISMDDGKVNFRQDLAECEKVKNSRGSSVTLFMKATINVHQNVHEDEEEDGFVIVKAPTMGSRCTNN